MLKIEADNKKRYIRVEGAGSVRDMAIEITAAANHIYQGLKQNNMHTAKGFITALRAYIGSDKVMEAPPNDDFVSVVVEPRGEHA